LKNLEQFTRRKNLVLGAVVTVVMIIIAIFAPLIAPYDPIRR
jgi:ABC-type dipeptide/oligopeptide/nickel transport system permease subunit